MKSIRPLLVPAACFMLAWAVTSLVSRRTEPPPPEEPPTSQHSGLRPRAKADRPRHQEITTLVAAFRDQPTQNWPELWDRFATRATVADLEALAVVTRVPRAITERRNAANSPRMLALEELAARSDLPPAEVPGAYAALAERDPEAVWQALEKHPRHDLSIAVARTLARHDPEGTLRRFQAMPAIPGRGNPYQTDAGEGGMSAGSPVAAVFAAWARRDPSAAAAAVRQLPLADQASAGGQVALTSAFRDGPAAVRFLKEIGMPWDVSPKVWRAALRTGGPESARLLANEPALMQAPAYTWGSNLWCIFKPWHDADPAGPLAWVLAEETTLLDYDTLDATARWNTRSRAMLDILSCDPQAAASMIRNLAAAGSNHGQQVLWRIHRRNPELAAELARELGVPAPGELEGTRHLINEAPLLACELLLERLDEHQDLEKALAAFGWDRSETRGLAARAARVFPETAAELKRLAPDLFKKQTATLPSSLPHSLLQLDPAAVVKSLTAEDQTRWRLRQVIDSWAPHDPAAAQAWVALLPDPDARLEGEIALLEHIATRDPITALESLVARPDLYPQNRPPIDPSTPHNLDSEHITFNYRRQRLSKVAASSLRRVMAAGGDWQSWLDRLPVAMQQSRNLTDLETEALLLEKLRAF